MTKIIRFLLLLSILFVVSFSGRSISTGEPNEDSKAITTGRDVPDFEMKIVGSAETLTKEKLLGKVYLLDFWMTRCKKCVDKMPFLHDIYEKYRGKDFVIISISADSSYEFVKDFRKGSWKMPLVALFGV